MAQLTSVQKRKIFWFRVKLGWSDWLHALIKPLSWNAALTRDMYNLEIDRQIVSGIYSSPIPGSLGGFAVIHGEVYEIPPI